ncbi:hypothetical protein, partial [Neokomagataea anthophila]
TSVTAVQAQIPERQPQELNHHPFREQNVFPFLSSLARAGWAWLRPMMANAHALTALHYGHSSIASSSGAPPH